MPFSIWWAIPGFVGLIGVLLFVGGVGKLFKMKFGSGIFRILFGGTSLGIAAVVALVGLNLQTYAQLSKERLAGQITLKKTGDFSYIATVDLADNGKLRGAPTDFQVTGEDFRIEGPVLKWKPWANVLGMDALFRVDHIEGVYVNTNCENQYDPRRADFAEKGGAADQFKSIRGLGESWKLINAVDVVNIQGSRVPMADGAAYDLKATQGGFELEPANEVAKDLQSKLLNRTGATCAPNNAPVQTPAGPAPTQTPQPASPNSPPTLTNNPNAHPAAPTPQGATLPPAKPN